jgi:hypothetical protein
MAAVTTRPFVNKQVVFIPRTMPKGGSPALNLAPSKGMREPGTGISTHTVAPQHQMAYTSIPYRAVRYT